MNEKEKIIKAIQHVLRQTKLSPHAGKYEALNRANWLQQTGRPMLEKLIQDLEENKP